jgi:hypothetical protein
VPHSLPGGCAFGDTALLGPKRAPAGSTGPLHPLGLALLIVLGAGVVKLAGPGTSVDYHLQRSRQI